MDTFDREVIKNINEYIKNWNLSVKKISNESGIAYHRLWSILSQSNSIKLSDYVAICRAFNEPLEIFFPEN